MERDETQDLRRNELPDDPSFAERILTRAFLESPAPGWRDQLRVLADDLRQLLPIPHPALAFSTIVAVGFLVGYFLQSGTTSEGTLDRLLYDTWSIL